MKKTVSMLLAVCMLFTLCSGASAANITETDEQSANTTVQYGVATRYTVTIPETVQITNARSTGAVVAINDALLPSNTRLEVSVTGESYTDDAWYLTDVNHDENQLRYSITQAADGAALADEDVVLTLNSGDQAAETNLTFALLDEVNHSGQYSDTITFAVNLNTNVVEHLVGIATFTDGTTLTWEELKDPKNGDKYQYNASGISDTQIDTYAFAENRSLVSITIQSGVTAINPSAFADCNVQNVTIPGSVTNLSRESFMSCTYLESVTLQNGVTIIGDYAFHDCPSLQNITISNSMVSIGSSAFFECINLENIVFNGTVEQWNTITLGLAWNFAVPATGVQCKDGVASL